MDPMFYRAAAALGWVFDQEHAARILRHHRGGNFASSGHNPFTVDANGSILVIRVGFQKPTRVGWENKHIGV